MRYRISLQVFVTQSLLILVWAESVVSDDKMKEEVLARWGRSHGFDQEKKRTGERRTFIVIALTIGMMALEITAGIASGSIALLADVLHMSSDAVALSDNFVAYVYARRQ